MDDRGFLRVGAFCSALAGFIGMNVATKANVRTTQAARTGLAPALNVAFSGGLVMGLSVVGLGVIGLGGLFIAYDTVTTWEINKIISVISGFSLGASSIALFARVGGGIYTKAADVGADLAGKVYEGIPEDDPRNPATIADNVGDNVGDVAGMGADLFESYVGSIIGTMVLGTAFLSVPAMTSSTLGELSPIILPLVLAGVGILVSIAGSFFVKTKEGGNPQHRSEYWRIWRSRAHGCALLFHHHFHAACGLECDGNGSHKGVLGTRGFLGRTHRSSVRNRHRSGNRILHCNR